MSLTIPMIRAGAMIPMLRWMTANRRPVERRLAEVDLLAVTFVEPDTPIPLLNAAAFFANAARVEGPDIGYRVVSENSIQELALIGRVILGAKTPRAALSRVSAMMPYHCSHEVLTVSETPQGIRIGEGWTFAIDDPTLHVIQQYITALIRAICSLTLAPPPLLSSVRMVPHPEYGFTHLADRLCVMPTASTSRFLEIEIKASVADRRFFKIARDRRLDRLAPDSKPLTEDRSLSGPARAVLRLHLLDGRPSIDRLAVAAGVSRRSLQRQFAAEGTSFSDLLEGLRRDMALQELEHGGRRIDDISAHLGYSNQSTLSRAVRRWTGQPPSGLRRRGL